MNMVSSPKRDGDKKWKSSRPNVCPQVVLLEKSNIALFTFIFSFCHARGDNFEAVSGRNNILNTSTQVFYFYTCVLRLCFWTNIILLCLHLDFHLVMKGEIPFTQSRRNNMLTTLLWRFCCFFMCVLRVCFWTNQILHCLHLD